MEIKQLQYILAIAKYRNLSYAARNLFITQPALSHQLNAVESELGTKLFIRNTHNVEITADGEKFCRYASDVISAMDSLYEAFDSDESKLKQSINLGLFPFFRYTQLSELLLSFFSDKKDIVGSLRVLDNYEAFADIKNGAIDFAIVKCIEDRISPDVNYVVLDREPYKLLVSSDRVPSGKTSISIAEVAELPVLVGSKGSHYYDDVQGFFDQFNLKFNVAFQNTLEAEWLIKMTERNIGVTFMTGTAADALAERPTLSALTIEENIETSIILAFSKTAPLSARSKGFMDYIIENYPKYES